MIKKITIFAVCVLAMLVIAPVTMLAADVTRTLQPNRTYEFRGLDARVIARANISGTGRYQLVEINAQGDVQSFGFSSWRISVSGTGRALVTPLAPMTVTFDSSRMSVTQSYGTALREFSLVPGETINITNNRLTAMHFRTDQSSTYDLLILDAVGEVYRTGNDIRLPQLSIAPGGTATVTATGDEALTVYFPSLWYGSEFTVSVPDVPALISYPLAEGQVYSFVNYDDEPVVIPVFPVYGDITFQFDFILRGQDGHVIDHGTTASEWIRIGANQTIVVIPRMDGELLFPFVLLDSFGIYPGDDTPVYHSLARHATIVVANNDPYRAHSVFVQPGNPDADVFGFEYVLVMEDEVVFNIPENVIAARYSIILPPESELIITAWTEALAVSVPDVAPIDARFRSATALGRHVLEPGQSVYIENSSDESWSLLPVADEDGVSLDFVRFDIEYDELVSFGRVEIQDYFVIESGMSALVTSPDYAVTLHFPRVLLEMGLVLTPSEEVALYSHVLSYGEVLQIENIDRRGRYNHLFLVHDESDRPRQGCLAYDFIMLTSRNEMIDFGMRTFGYHHLPANRRVVLAPQPGTELSVLFPTAWSGRYLRTRVMTEAPLHHITLTPGQSIVIDNTHADQFVLRNNSVATEAGFHIHGPGHYERQDWMLAFGWTATYLYVPQPPLDLEADTPQTGDIVIPPNIRLTITAAWGEDLEIWLPMSWARRLRLVF